MENEISMQDEWCLMQKNIPEQKLRGHLILVSFGF